MVAGGRDSKDLIKSHCYCLRPRVDLSFPVSASSLLYPSLLWPVLDCAHS